METTSQLLHVPARTDGGPLVAAPPGVELRDDLGESWFDAPARRSSRPPTVELEIDPIADAWFR